MNQNGTKNCPMCASKIDVGAKKCPQCHHFQNKLTACLYNPAFGALVAVIPMMILLMCLGMMAKQFLPDAKQYSDYHNCLSVVESALSFGQRQKDDQVLETVVVLGKITNSSDIVWEDISLEVTCFDENGILVDACQDKQYGRVVPAKGSATFKVFFERQFPKAKYVSHAVRVLSASEKKNFL